MLCRKGGNFFCISKKSKKILKSYFLSRELVFWMAKVVEIFLGTLVILPTVKLEEENESSWFSEVRMLMVSL